MKQLASAAGVSALMGITEPALYGVTLKLKRPVVAASIAAGIGGIVGGLLQVSLYIAQNCIMAIPAFIGEKGLSNLLYGIIMIVVSFVAAFVLTLIFGFEDVKAETEDEVQNTDTEKQPAQQNAPLVDKIELCAPVAGTVKALSDVPDKTFADKVLGDGAAIVPSEGKVYAPADGTVANIMDSKHGIMFVTESGAEILIHIGLDTVNLNGKYFKSHVSEGDKVKKGKLLVEFDMDAIKKEGYDLITPVVVTTQFPLLCLLYGLCFVEAFRFVVMIVILTLKQKDGMIIQGSIRKLTAFLMKKMYCRTIMITELMVLET